MTKERGPCKTFFLLPVGKEAGGRMRERRSIGSAFSLAEGFAARLCEGVDAEA